MTYAQSVRYLLTLGRELATSSHARAQKFDLRNITLLAGRFHRRRFTHPLTNRNKT